jgi:hypothetical protein
VWDFVLVVYGKIFRHKVKGIRFMLLNEFIGGNFCQEIYWHMIYWQIDSASKLSLLGGI